MNEWMNEWILFHRYGNNYMGLLFSTINWANCLNKQMNAYYPWYWLGYATRFNHSTIYSLPMCKATFFKPKKNTPCSSLTQSPNPKTRLHH